MYTHAAAYFNAINNRWCEKQLQGVQIGIQNFGNAAKRVCVYDYAMIITIININVLACE